MNTYILTVNKDNLFSKESIKRLNSNKDNNVIFITKLQPIDSLTKIFNDKSEKIIAIDPMFFNWSVPNIFLDRISNVKAICLQSTSFGWIDTKYANSKHIPVVNVRNYCTEAVAEWAFMMALNVARKIPVVIQNKWKYDYAIHQGVELRGKTAGIIGLGNIGTRLAELCQAFGMEVLYWSKNSRDKRFKYTSLRNLMKTSDLIFPTLTRNEESEKLITDSMLLNMKQSAIFVSIVRNVYNEELLFKLVEEGKVYGVANEAETQTPEINGNIWSGLRLAWCTKESFENNGICWTENIINASKEIFESKVN
jgi:lactate dehydrogenase-like 2-hydroxyacid dehydrogenase